MSWAGAFADDRLVGFVHACRHAFVLDNVVDPDHQGEGIGRALVLRLITEVRGAGCEWLHVDYGPHLDAF